MTNTNTMTVNTTTCTVKDFKDIKFFLPYNFDFSKCYYNAEQHKNYFIVDLSKVGVDAEMLIENNLGLLLEYDDAMVGSNLEDKRVNICIFGIDTDSIIEHIDNQIIGNKHFYGELDFIAKHLKEQSAIIKSVEIKPDIKSLYDDLKSYDKYHFYFLNRDKNNFVTFRYELHFQKIKLNGRHSIDFVVGSGDKYSNFAILSNIRKIKKKLSNSDITERYYFESYDFTVYFDGSDEPLEFSVSKTERNGEENQ